MPGTELIKLFASPDSRTAHEEPPLFDQAAVLFCYNSFIKKKSEDAAVITVVGSLNMDLVVQTEHIPRVGETVLARDLRHVEGGKGANQTVAAARLGGRVSMIGAVGRDEMGDRLIQALETDKVNVSGIKRSSEATGIAMIIVDANGNNAITVEIGRASCRERV